MEKRNSRGPNPTRPIIGFLTPNLFWDELWGEMLDAARASDINLFCFLGDELQSHQEFRDQANVVYDLASADLMDGLILWNSALSNFIGGHAFRQFCKRYQPLPMVDLDDVPEKITDTHSYRGMREAILHLITQHDCRRIAFIRGPTGNNLAEERYAAYCDVLREYHLPYDSDLVVLPGFWLEPSGQEAIRILCDERQADFDAIVTASDRLAIGAIDALQARNLQVPYDVAVVSYDNAVHGRCITPPLTTMPYPMQETTRKAIAQLLAQIMGMAALPTEYIQTPLVIRQSCGCVDPMIKAAGEVHREYSNDTGTTFEQAIVENRKAILTAMAHILNIGSHTMEWTAEVFDAFAADVLDSSSNDFLSTLDRILRYTIASAHTPSTRAKPADVSVWQDGISILCKQVFPLLHEPKELARAVALWQQARLVIGQTAQRIRAHQKLQAKQQGQTLQKIGARLISIFDLSQLTDVIAEELPHLEIPSCFISLYTDPQTPTGSAKLILAYREWERIPLRADGVVFSSTKLIPPNFLPTHRSYVMIVEPLYFQNHQIGFAVFEAGPREGDVYEMLRAQISSSLQGALLVQRVQQHAAELTRQKYILDTFMENIPDGVYFKDCDSRIMHSNNAHAARFGFKSPLEQLGKTDFDVLPPELASRTYAQEQEIMRTGQPLLALEEPGIWGSWLLTTKMPLRDEHGEIIGTFGISRDITALKEIEKALRQAKDDAEEARTIAEEARKAAESANKAKGEFLANMSHELRTPLNIILGLAQLMARNPRLSDEDRENIETMRTSGGHLLMLINNVLNMSKIEAGCMMLNERNVDLFEILDELREMFALRAEQKQLQLVFTCADGVPQYIEVDDTRLRQVLMNLINNAITFTESGNVELRIDSPEIFQPVSGQAKILKFNLEDTGPGIAPDELPMLFNAFQQTTTGRQAQEGTGLGLTICQKFVHLLGGELTVQSTPGQGTCFAFTIPVKVSMTSDIAYPLQSLRIIGLASGQPEYRILVVDNRREHRALLVKLLAPLGIQVQEAANGQEAIAVWKTFSPHLIWMDMRMPVMDGYEAARQIKATTHGQATVIIALTASSFEEEQAIVLSTGCDDVLCKPFRETDIFTLMQKHLGVQYLYKEQEAPITERQPANREEGSPREFLNNIPDTILDELRQAVRVADVEMTEHLIEQVQSYNTTAADLLTAELKQFRFDLLQTILAGGDMNEECE